MRLLLLAGASLLVVAASVHAEASCADCGGAWTGYHRTTWSQGIPPGYSVTVWGTGVPWGYHPTTWRPGQFADCGHSEHAPIMAAPAAPRPQPEALPAPRPADPAKKLPAAP